MKKYLFSVTTIIVDDEGKKDTSFYSVVAPNVQKALDYLVNEKGLNLDNVDFVNRKEEIPVVE